MIRAPSARAGSRSDSRARVPLTWVRSELCVRLGTDGVSLPKRAGSLARPYLRICLQGLLRCESIPCMRRRWVQGNGGGDRGLGFRRAWRLSAPPSSNSVSARRRPNTIRRRPQALRIRWIQVIRLIRYDHLSSGHFLFPESLIFRCQWAGERRPLARRVSPETTPLCRIAA
jgi:hypothetical protein